MKKIFFVLPVVIFLSCSITDQQKAESSIEKYLKDKLDDPSSYESVEFGTAEPEYKDFSDASIDNWEIAEYNNEMYSKLKDWENRKEYKFLYDTNIQQADDSISYYQELYKEASTIYYKATKEYEDSDKEQIGWRIYHTFRAKNKFGAIVRQKNIFVLDSNFLVKRSWKPIDQE